MKKNYEFGNHEARKGTGVILFILFVLSSSLAGCAGGVHGNVNAGVTGSVLNPADAQFHAGGEIDFAKRPHAKGAADAKDY